MLVPLVPTLPPLESFTKSARVNTDTGLDCHITAPEDTDAVEARGIQNPPVFGLKPLGLLVERLALGVAERAVRGLGRKLRRRNRMSLSAEVAPSATFKKLMPSLTLRAAWV